MQSHPNSAPSLSRRQALRSRVEAVIARARDLDGDPEALATFFHLAVGVVEGESRRRALELARWYDAEAALPELAR